MILGELTGHSGCKIYLCEEKNKKFVRKISSSEEYNARLMSQATKQKKFSSNLASAPTILGDGSIHNLYFFDMEYIGGRTFSNFISLNTAQEIRPMIEKLFKIILRSETHNSKRDYTLEIFNKTQALQRDAPIDVQHYIKYCLDFDWTQISSGFCHGDLTFENIIIYKSEIFLIDFLDSFIDTKYIDISKILQDVLLSWSWRNTSPAPVIKNIYIYNLICSFLSAHEKSVINRLFILNVLRIMPYSDKKSCTLIENKLKYIIERLEK